MLGKIGYFWWTLRRSLSTDGNDKTCPSLRGNGPSPGRAQIPDHSPARVQRTACSASARPRTTRKRRRSSTRLRCTSRDSPPTCRRTTSWSGCWRRALRERKKISRIGSRRSRPAASSPARASSTLDAHGDTEAGSSGRRDTTCIRMRLGANGARYAREKLNCTMRTILRPGRDMDCFFSVARHAMNTYQFCCGRCSAISGTFRWRLTIPLGSHALQLPIGLFVGGVVLTAWLQPERIKRAMFSGASDRLSAWTVATLAALLITHLWVVAANGHMTHTFFNAIVFYIPFLPMVYVLLAAAIASWLEHGVRAIQRKA